MQKRDVRSRWLLGARGGGVAARWAAHCYSKAQWVPLHHPWAGTRASQPASSPPPRPPSPPPHPLPTLPQRQWQRPWARGHGQPGVSWRRSQLLLPVLRAFSGSLTRPSKSGGPVRRQARQSPCSGLAATAASSHCSSQRRASAEGGGGRAGAARSGSARRRSFPNSPSPRAPRASRASGASFGTPWPWPRAHGRCCQRWGRVGRGWGVQAGGRGGGLLAG